MEMDNGQTFIIKHWRQDWAWQPASVLTYAGAGEWVLSPVGADERAGVDKAATAAGRGPIRGRRHGASFGLPRSSDSGWRSR